MSPHVGNFPREYPKPLTIGCSAFVPWSDQYDWEIATEGIRNRASLESQNYYAPVLLPDGVTINKVTLIGYKDDELAVMRVQLWRADWSEGTTLMAEAVAPNWGDNGSISDTSITEPVVDNDNYFYGVMVELDPNDSINDVRLHGVQVHWN